MAQSKDDWFTCPVCSEVVRADALACPHCGSDDETGWSEASAYDEADLPEETLGETSRTTKQQSPAFTYVTVGLIVVILVVWVLAGY